MIRKCLKGLCITLLTLLPISFSSANWQEFDIGLTEEITANTNLGYDLLLENGANFKLNNQWRVIQYQGAGTYSRLRTWFRNNGTSARQGMYVMSSCAGGFACQNIHTSIMNQGFIENVNILSSSEFNQYCDSNGWCGYGNTDASLFYGNSQYSNPDKLYIGGNGEMQGSSLCFGYSSLDKVVCFSVNQAYTYNTTGSMGFTYNPYIEELGKFADQISPFFSISKFGYVEPNIPSTTGGSVDGSVYTETTTGGLINYFEESPYYKFNIDMCYIGTRDIVSVYEDRIPYHQGTGYTIFDFYSKLYNVNSFQITQVGSFINTRYINFATWFGGENRSSITGDPLYNAYYTYGSGFRLDQGSGLQNPFLGNLSAYYFLGSIYDSLPSLSNTPGEELATYCYKKLYTAKGTPSNDGSSYNITDNHNQAYDQNANMFNTTRERHHQLISGNLILDAKSWDGTPLDYFDSDAGNNMNFNDFFSSAFNKFKYSFGTMTPDAFGVGALPGYIILFLLAIIFFRFLSH